MLLSSLALAAANAAADAPGTRDRGAPLLPLLLPPDSGGMEPAPAAPLCGAPEDAMTAAAICSAVAGGEGKEVKGEGCRGDDGSTDQPAWGRPVGLAAVQRRRWQQHAQQGSKHSTAG